MWNIRGFKQDNKSEFISSFSELLQSTSRTIFFTVGCILLVWYFVATLVQTNTYGWNVLVVTPIIFLVIIVAYRLLPSSYLSAQVVWQVGLGLSILLAMWLFQKPEIGLFFSILPLMASVMVNGQAGVLSELMLFTFIFATSQIPGFPRLSLNYCLSIIVGGAITGLLGWASTRALLTVTQWSLFSYHKVQQQIDETRNTLVELKQVQEDLIHANQEMARLTERLKEMNLIAEKALRTKEEFVSNVSHELRTPLNMIIGFSEIITESTTIYGENLPQKLLADIHTIRRNSLNLAKLVNDVLDLSQVEAGRMALSREWTQLQEIIGETVLALRPLFLSKGLYLKIDIPDDLPSVFIDSIRISQVITNLLNNAGRFTIQGGVEIKVSSDEDRIVVSVSDTGPGIAPDNLERIFEPFEQIDNSIKRKYGGSGLGLSISRKFVEMHSGKMWAESILGSGTTFYFSLPIEPSFTTVFAGSYNAKRWFNPFQQYSGRDRPFKALLPKRIPHLLILEDGNELQHLFTRYVNGVEVTSVNNIEEAILKLDSSPSQALILNGPNITTNQGFSDFLKKLPYGTPAISCWVPGENEIAGRLGVAKYIVKPVTKERLLSVLKNLGREVKQILIVDDSQEILQLFSRVLSSADQKYRVIRADNGHRALEILRERKPDVMLLDLIMPEMDGFQVLEEKIKDPSIKDIPVIIVTSRDPSNEPIMSNSLSVVRGGGLTAIDLLSCIQAIVEILSPSGDQWQLKANHD